MIEMMKQLFVTQILSENIWSRSNIEGHLKAVLRETAKK